MRSLLSIYLPVLTLALLGGGVALLGSPTAVGLFLALIVLAMLLYLPFYLVWISLIFSFVVDGILEFSFGIGQANWLASILCAALFGVAVVIRLTRFRSPASKRGDQNSILPLMWAYLLALAVASLANGGPFVQVIVGIRNYFPFVGICLALAYCDFTEKQVRGLIWGLIAIALIQWPFCLYQHLFIAPQRAYSLVAVGGGAESIVGTFAGDPLGGGYTGELAIFLVVVLGVVLSLWRASQVRFWLFLVAGLSSFLCIALAETKVVIVLVPLIFGIILWDEIKESPSRIVSLAVLCLLFVGGISAIYAWRYWSPTGDFFHAFTYSFDPEFMVDPFHRGRVGTIVHWYKSNIATGDIFNSLIGYGMASTLETSRVMGVGNAVRKFGFGLDAHAMSKLLWDGGLVAFVLFVSLILRSISMIKRILQLGVVPPWHASVLRAFYAGLICSIVILPYQNSIVAGPPMQFLFWFMLGYVEYWRTLVAPGKQMNHFGAL